MDKIFILNSCNEWKEFSSMGLIMASTSLEKIKDEIINQIEEGNMEYKRDCENMLKTKPLKYLGGQNYIKRS